MVIKDSTKWLYYKTLVPLFSEQIVLKKFKPVHSGHCADMCGKIAPGAITFWTMTVVNADAIFAQ